MKNFKFFLRKQGKNDPVVVFQIFDARFKNRKFMYSTGRFCPAAQWDKKKQRAQTAHVRSHQDFVFNIAKAWLEARINSRTLSREELKSEIISRLKDEEQEYVKKRVEGEETWEIWKHIIDTTKTRAGKPIKPSTKTQKTQTMNMVKDYAVAKNKTLTFLSMDINFYHDFDKWLQERGNGGNTRGKQMKEIKAILSEADDRDIPVSGAHRKKSWKVIKQDVDSVFLNQVELRQIFECKKVLPQDRRKRDIFIQACFVGARHSDWCKIDPKYVIKQGDREFLKVKQTKGENTVFIPLHPAVKSIWRLYNNQAIKVPSLKECNEALKRIAKAAKLGKCIVDGVEVEKWEVISTHTARRSFATNAFLSKSMEMREIMQITGHKTESNFLKYLKLQGFDFAAMSAESKFFNEEWSMLRAV